MSSIKLAFFFRFQRMMKALMVVYIPLLSQCLGKYYLTKTIDKVSRLPYKPEGGVDYSNDDDKCEAETLINATYEAIM